MALLQFQHKSQEKLSLVTAYPGPLSYQGLHLPVRPASHVLSTMVSSVMDAMKPLQVFAISVWTVLVC